MALDLQKLTIRRILDSQDHNLYSKVYPVYFTGVNTTIFNRIQSFYKSYVRLPSTDEFKVLKKEASLQEYLETQILSEENVYEDIADEFLLGQLQDYYIRDETISFLDKFIDDLPELENVEIVDKLQNHLLTLNKSIPMNDELYDVTDIAFIPNPEDFVLHPTGISTEYDTKNGGLALQELVLLGGRRGSGKSILALNMAINRYLQGNTVALFSVEMRYKEVYDRLLSILSEVSFLKIFKNELTVDDKMKLVKAKIDNFYDPGDMIQSFYSELQGDHDFKKFESKVKENSPKLKDTRFFIVDDESLTLNRIDHYNNMFSNKHPNYNMAVVDYLNIIKHENSKDWQTQIVIAEALKASARKFNLTMLSPYQIDASGEARFAKGILDSADRSFAFFPAAEGEDREQENKLEIHTTKIRNGVHMSFDIYMNWDCVKVDPNQSKLINERPHQGAMFSDKEGSRDV
jgi:replicative DNA helicase